MSDRTLVVRYEQEIPDVLQALQSVHKTIDVHGFDRKIYHLVLLRASQINHCAHCVKMHTREAREDSETNDRLDRIIVWEHVSDFSERERAALAWTEALTYLDRGTNYAALRAQLRKHFSDKEIAVRTTVVAMINMWNRLGVSRH